MAKNILTNIDLNGNEIQNFVEQPLGTAPTTHLKVGRRYFDTAENRGKVYNGTSWLREAYMTDIENLSAENDELDERIAALEAYFSSSEDADEKINKWNEIVAFLNAAEGETLDEILSNFAQKTRKINAGAGLTGGGDLTADRTLSLAESGVSAGTYTKITVDKYGRVTSGSNPTTLEGMGITDAYTKDQVIQIEERLSESINGILETEINPLAERVTQLEEKATSVSVSQTLTSGIEIGSVTVDGKETKLYAPTAEEVDLTGYAKKHAARITCDGSTTSYPIAHNLGTTDVTVNVWRFVSGTVWEQVVTDVETVDSNNVKISFGLAPTSGNVFRIIVIG